jgi:NADH:ubiquinone oxidoreductase subunit E
MEKLDTLIESFKTNRSSLIGLLQDVSEEFGYLSEDVLERISDELNVPLSHLYSLATFYTSFRLEPMGEHLCSICVGTACHVRGATAVVDAIEQELDIDAGETTPDGKFTVEKVNCLGACALGPLVVIDNEYYGKLDRKKTVKLINKFKE